MLSSSERSEMQRDQINGGRFFLKRRSSATTASPPARNAVFFLFVAVVLAGGLVSARWIINSLAFNTSTAPSTLSAAAKNQNLNVLSKSSPKIAESIKKVSSPPTPVPPPPPPPRLYPFTCPTINNTASHICPSPPPHDTSIPPPSSSCPDYFRWIHEDLHPWKTIGITKEMVDRAARTANFRVVILNGRAYIETFRKSFQSRDIFTLWGIIQLLRRYPGQVPDVDFMFDCVDWPVIRASHYRGKGKTTPPPLFRYCGDDSTLDIVFPDWTFWGWPEINIKPWDALLKELTEGNKKVKWMDREPYAYWKGNPAVATTRMQLLKCNNSKDQDWNARIFAQDWHREIRSGFKQSDLASQCNHRFKIYVEGSAWSVSNKYILACDSLSLIVKPHYYDFFTRGLMPVHHYWPIRGDDDMCRSVKFAVDWGNSHKQKAQAIGKEASTLIQEKLKMDHVYDYMFHLISEYAKLLKYKPVKPQNAVELCAESMGCPAGGLERKFMMDSMVRAPHGSAPCSMPPPFNPAELTLLQSRKANSIKQVEIWEQRAWESKSS